MDTRDKSSGYNILWFLLSFFIPIVGIVLQIVWWKDRHSNAKACIWGWIIPVGFMAVMIVGSLILGMLSALSLI